jgi:uncharacterized SAM-binding protein YcdF (DUF218 family)
MRIGKTVRWLIAITFVLTVLVMAFLSAGRFLAAPARAPVKSDLLVSLGGDDGGRSDRALELYKKGYAPRILLTGPEGAHWKLRVRRLNWRARYFVEEGVPERALLYDRESRNSWEEAVSTLRLMQSMKLDRALVVSDPPHMRRLSWVWGRVFAGSGKEFILVASDMEGWDAAHWWRTSPNAQFVFGEYIKLAYYVVQY